VTSKADMPGLSAAVAGGNAHRSAGEHPIKIGVTNLSFYYGDKRALQDISIDLRANVVTAFIGPSGCGKSTFLRTLNRMNDVIPKARVEGTVNIGGRDIYGADVDVVELRRRVGMVFQKPNPFSKSIFDNVATVFESTASSTAAPSSPTRLRKACVARRCGTKSRIGCTNRRWRSRAGSSSGCASPARWRSSRRSC
jgi:ABC-type multidrug transport system fused ATPase/permease subunit